MKSSDPGPLLFVCGTRSRRRGCLAHGLEDLEAAHVGHERGRDAHGAVLRFRKVERSASQKLAGVSVLGI